MQTKKRALRRHHRQRMIRRALRSFVVAWHRDESERLAQAVRYYNNLKKCSCGICGNPRKYRNEVTVQERRQQEAARYDLYNVLILQERKQSENGDTEAAEIAEAREDCFGRSEVSPAETGERSR